MKLKGFSYLRNRYRRTDRTHVLDLNTNKMVEQRVRFEFEITDTHYYIFEYNLVTRLISKGTISILKWNDYVRINLNSPYNLSLGSAVKYASRYFIEWERDFKTME